MAIENGVQNAELGYILDPAFQIENINGKPAVGGHIEIFEAGTDNKYISYQNFDGAQNPFKIPLGSDGRAVILGDPSLSYDVYAYDSYNNLMFSRLNVQCNVPGTINLSGADTRINNTDGTLDISLRTLGNNVRQYTINTHNKVLDVQSPLYFVENSETATVIGFSGDDYASKEYVDSAVSSKLDTTAFRNVSGDFLTDKFEYDDDNNITAYNHSAFAGGGGSGPNYEAGDHIAITDNVISVTGLPDSADLENAISSAVTNVENKFEYNENNYITAYNNSAFAGTNYSAGDYVSIENDTISVTGLQPSGDYATHDDLTAYATKEDVESATSGKQDTLSAGDGISIVNNTISVTSQGGGIEQVNHDDTLSGNGNSTPLGIANIEDFVKQNDLTAYQPVGDYYSASNPSGFITNDAITGLQPSGDYATHDDLTGYATTALVSSVSSELYSAISGISGDFELVAGSGVELVDDPNAKTTTINVTAEGTPVTAIEQMIESATSGLQPSGDYATTAQLADKLDTTAFSTVSGSFLTAHQDLSNYATTASVTAKLDTTAFSTVSSNFLTAVDLTPYQTTAGMTAYQPVGDYYSASNPSGFLTAVPAGTMNESNFGYDASNNITAYNGSAFKAGAGGLTVCAYSAISSDLGAFRNTIKDDPEQYAVSFTSGNNIRIAYFYLSGANASPDSVNPYITVHSDYYTYRIDDNTETSSLGISHSYKDYGGFTGQEVTIGVKSKDTVGGSVPTGTMNESAFEYDANDKISGYNGSAFAGGGDFPQSANDAINYVTANSGDIDSTIDNVSSNSAAWGGEKLPIIAGNGIALSYDTSSLTISAVPASFYSAGIANIVLTASMPGSPDANTLYLIPE